MENISTIFWFLYLIPVIFIIVVIIMDKREPVRALAWICVVALLPYAGIILYIFFGRNFRKEKIFSRKGARDEKLLKRLSQRQLKLLSTANLEGEISENKEIITLMLNNSRSLLTLHNRVKVLNNGSETFPEIIKTLHEAKQSIHLEYYIIENDALGESIADILVSKALEGVEVRLIYDDVGSWSLSRRYIARLQRAGVKVYCFMPVMFPLLTSKLNYRNHRKIVVVDSKVAFTGGINIAERYIKGTKLGKWRDTHLKIEGEAVAQLQKVFALDWFFVSRKQLLDDEKYFPQTNIDDFLPVQIASSGPDSHWASIMQAFFAAICKAKNNIFISSPYFLPNQAVLTALKVAAMSGVDVRILLPSRSDSKIVYWATRSYIEELLEAGIKVYFYKKGFNHSKLIIIDENFASVGTANMDIRSFEHNFEVAALIYDKKTATELSVAFERDIDDAKQLNMTQWRKRPLRESIYESFARLLGPLL
ncbi:MAG: cardiolipin synthase [Rikenellaceae bacterium]